MPEAEIEQPVPPSLSVVDPFCDEAPFPRKGDRRPLG
jgi:hypothetical protein